MKKSLIILFALSALVSATQTTENFAFSSPSSTVAFKNVFDLSKDWELKTNLKISPIYQKTNELNLITFEASGGSLSFDSHIEKTSSRETAGVSISSNNQYAFSYTQPDLPDYCAYTTWGIGMASNDGPVSFVSTLTYNSTDKIISFIVKASNGEEFFQSISISTTFNGAVLTGLSTGITQNLLDIKTVLEYDNQYHNIWFLPSGTFTGTIIPLAPEAGSGNGAGGQGMINDIIMNTAPQPGGDLSKLVDSVNAGMMTEEAMAAVAGASVVVPGQALHRDVERQLEAMRNRVAFGYAGRDTITIQSTDEKGSPVSIEESKPHSFRVWVNAESNRAEQDADSTAAGYTLSSWGATLGAGMQVNDKLTVGLALTSMFGDLKSDGPDYLEGDMDTSYVSAFAGYNSGKWSHALIGTAGVMEADMNRRVSHAAGSYSTYGETEGMGLGIMYEVSRAFALKNGSSISPMFNISYRHTEVDAYNESNSDAALNVDEQSLNTVTLGAGVRYNVVVGEQTLNRPCSVHTRALAKYDLGDRTSETTVGFIGRSRRAHIESAELGAFGVELGAGVSVPVGCGSLFADGEVELRSDYTNFNATVGYQLTF